MEIGIIRKLYAEGRIYWSQHCLERMGERDISIDDLSSCINNGEVIEDYPEDYPFPSCLVFGFDCSNKYLHAVVGCDGDKVYIITVYVPNSDKFETDGKTRKERK